MSRPDVVGFLDQNYRYKSADTQIPYYAGLATIQYADLIPIPQMITT